MSDQPRARVIVQMTITTAVEVVDAGYLGTGATVAEHIKQAKESARSWQVFIKQGAGDPQMHRAKMEVAHVTIIEEKS